MLRLHPMFEMDGEIGGAETGALSPEAGEGTTSSEPVDGQTGETQPEAGVTDKQEIAWNKRIAAEREKIRAEIAEQYKDYDAYRDVAEFFREKHQFDDVLTLKEEVEMARLQERAEKEGLTPEVQRRLESLEQRAARADELEEQQRLASFYREFRTDLEKFVDGKGVEADELEKFMVENKLSNMDIAFKAMKFQDAESKREEIEKEAVKKYLESKKAPKTEGAGTAGYVAPKPPTSWEEARRNAAEMMRNARQIQ